MFIDLDRSTQNLDERTLVSTAGAQYVQPPEWPNDVLFRKEILLYTPFLKWYLQQGLKITQFHCAIKYTPEKSFQQFADEVSDARRAGNIDDSKKLIAETMKLFRNSAYGKTVINKEKFVSTSYGNEDNISIKKIVHISKI